MRTVAFNSEPTKSKYADDYANHYMHAYSQVTARPKTLIFWPEDNLNKYYYNLKKEFKKRIMGKKVESDPTLPKVDAFPALTLETEYGGVIRVPKYEHASTPQGFMSSITRLALTIQVYSNDKGIIFGTKPILTKTFIDTLTKSTEWPIVTDNDYSYLVAPLFMYNWVKQFNPQDCDVKAPSSVPEPIEREGPRRDISYATASPFLEDYSPQLTKSTKDMFKK